MRADFSQPQRQSPIGVVVMFAYTFQQYARAFWPLLLVWALRWNEVNKLYVALGSLAIIIVVGVVSYLRYLNFTFFLDKENDEFVITEGILNKTKTAIQLNKIQQVNINQSFIQKLIGVYELSVDTAGSSKKEGNIKAISHQLALALKSELLENEKKTVKADEISIAENPEREITTASPFIKIGFLSLLKVGITSNYGRSLALLLLFFSTIYENFKDFTDDDFLNDEQLDSYVDEASLINALLFFLVFLFLVVLVINVVRVVFKYFNYKITRQKGSLLLSFGLLNTKNTIIKPEKVHVTTITQNFLQKKMDILEIRIKQATSGGVEERKSMIEIPGCSQNERDEILKLLFSQIPEKGVMLKPNFRKLVFALFLSVIIPVGIYFAFANWIDAIAYDFIYIVPFYVIFVGLVQFFRFRNNRLFIHENFIIRQSGAWDISNEIIEPHKIQAVETSQLFWHKNLNIGSLTLHTAGGSISFQLGNFDTIRNYANLWLYELETSDSNWM